MHGAFRFASVCLLWAGLMGLPSASAGVSVCVPPGSPTATCAFADGHANGEGRCDGFANNGGTVGVRQQDESGSQSTYVQNGCYDSEDEQGTYHGSYIGVYRESSTGEFFGVHWNAGTHEAYGDYCTIGSVDPEGPRVQCPPIVDVPVVLSILL